MRHRWWIAALIAAAVFGLAQPSRAGLKDLLHPKQKQVDNDLTVACIKSKAWIGYFKDSGGRYSPVRDTMDTKRDSDWLGLRYTDYDGPRIRLGVLKVINKSTEVEEDDGNGRIEVPVAGIREMLTVALFDTKRFDVIEQKRAAEIEKEQTRKDVVEPSPKTIMDAGKMLGAQYLVYGTVNEWSPERGNKSIKKSILPGSLFGGAKKDAEVAITFVLTDVANGQNLFTTTERARIGEWNLSVAGGLDGGTEQKTPVSYAVRACASKAAFKIATFLRNQKWKGTVVDVKKGNIYINAGNQQGMSPDTQLSVFKVQGVIRDAEGRMVLGEDLKGTGTLRVDSVQPGFSIAHVENGCKGIGKGDRVELATPLSPPPIPPGCAEKDPTLAP